MQPRLIYRPAFSVVGLPSQNGDVTDPARMDALWARLGERYTEIPQADPDIGFGVHTWTTAGHHYLAGMAQRKAGPVPQGRERSWLPAHAYAVFPHAGPMVLLPETLGQIFEGWLPTSGYRRAEAYYFELFDDRFVPHSAQSLLFLYIPVAS